MLERNIVDKADRLRANANDVVDVHGNAVYSDSIKLVHDLRNEHLRADPVRMERKELRT